MSDSEEREPVLVENPRIGQRADEHTRSPEATPESVALDKMRDIARQRQERHVARARALKEKFNARTDRDIGEVLLEELVAEEAGVIGELLDSERIASGLLSSVMDQPEVALAVARVLREIVLVSAAVRRRTERSLAAAAELRAQRTFLRRANGN